MKKLDKAVKIVLERLNNHNYEAYLVGGAVRDFLLNKTNNDYDITTNASSNAIKMLFNDHTCFDIGKKLGTVVVLIDNKKIDITPYRKESDYKDHRHPSSISFDASLKDDLKRRDFTINAMCIDKDLKIIDYHNGISDLEKGIIKTVNNAKARFNEDALRILRAIRFKAQLGFDIENKTSIQIHKCKDLLNYISPERKKEELLHLLSYKKAFVIINEYLDVFQTFMPFVYNKRKINNFTDPLFALAYLLKDCKNINLKNQKYSNQEIELIRLLIASTKIKINDDYRFITILSNTYQKQILLFLKQYHRLNLDKRFNKLKKYMIELNDLDITGLEISKYGYHKKQLGLIKKHLLDLIHHKKLINNNKQLHDYLKNNIINF